MPDVACHFVNPETKEKNYLQIKFCEHDTVVDSLHLEDELIRSFPYPAHVETSNIEHLADFWVFLEEVHIKCVKIGASLKPVYANYGGWPFPSGFHSPYDLEYELLICGIKDLRERMSCSSTEYREKHQDQAVERRPQLVDTTVQYVK